MFTQRTLLFNIILFHFSTYTRTIYTYALTVFGEV